MFENRGLVTGRHQSHHQAVAIKCLTKEDFDPAAHRRIFIKATVKLEKYLEVISIPLPFLHLDMEWYVGTSSSSKCLEYTSFLFAPAVPLRAQPFYDKQEAR